MAALSTILAVGAVAAAASGTIYSATRDDPKTPATPSDAAAARQVAGQQRARRRSFAAFIGNQQRLQNQLRAPGNPGLKR